MVISVKGLAIVQEQMGCDGLGFQIREPKFAIHVTLSCSCATSIKKKKSYIHYTSLLCEQSKMQSMSIM